jgi:hypothetical protein
MKVEEPLGGGSDLGDHPMFLPHFPNICVITYALLVAQAQKPYIRAMCAVN